MLERLQKIISMAGMASRREAEKYISDGRVTVNGVVVSELGAKADPSKDRIAVDGKPVALPERKLYILLNKPSGYVTTLKDPQGRPVVTDLLRDLGERVYPVGRLDYNTEGLLLLTNDGEWANLLMHPRHEVEKEYLVRVRGVVAPEQVRRLAEGVELEDGRTAPAEVNLLRETGSSSWISIVIHEGRYRQVRRMCEAVSLAVVRLKRIRYGFLELERGMRPGGYRLLTEVEAAQLSGRKITLPGEGSGGKRTETGAKRDGKGSGTSRTPGTAGRSDRRSSGSRKDPGTAVKRERKVPGAADGPGTAVRSAGKASGASGRPGTAVNRAGKGSGTSRDAGTAAIHEGKGRGASGGPGRGKRGAPRKPGSSR